MDVTIGAKYSGRPYELRMRVYTVESNVGGNWSTYHADRYGYSQSGYGSFANNSYTCNSWIGGQHAGGAYSLPFAPGDYAGKTIGFGSYNTAAIGHDSAGYLNFTIRVQMLNASVFGSADTGDVWVSADRIAKVPGTPGTPTVSEVTTTSMRLSWTIPGDNGASIDQMLLRYSTRSDFSTYTDVVNAGNATSAVVTDLTPGTTYYWRVYAHNSVGYSPSSGVTTQATLPSVPPGMTVTPDASGTQATVTLSPPGGVSGVSSYTIERRLRGSTTATSMSTTSTTATATLLTPGATYEWRARAQIGSYDSPWTGWTSVFQTDPGATPSTYFDGGTLAKPNGSYAWDGTAGKSRTTMTGVHPAGWLTFAGGQRSGPKGSGVVYRATGGRFGSYHANVSIRSEVSAAAGQQLLTVGIALDGSAEVVSGAVYWSSLWLLVGPGAVERASVRPGVEWYDADDEYLSTSYGDIETYPSLASHQQWRRFSAQVEVPAGAVRGAPIVTFIAKSGFKLLSGMAVKADGAMLSITPADYFDGSTAATPGYEYEWLGTPGQSESIRLPVAYSTSSLLSDPDCPPPPAPPRPPAVPNDCIADIDTWRRYALQVGDSLVRANSDVVPTLTLTTGDSAERQVRVRTYPNPDGLAPALLDIDSWEAEQILTYIPPRTTLVLDGVSQQAWASVDGSEQVSADHLLYGTGGTPATWPVLSCGHGYVITLDVPTESAAGNLTASLQLTRRF